MFNILSSPPYYKRMDFFKKLNKNKDRKANALKTHLLCNFGIENQQADIVVNRLMSH